MKQARQRSRKKRAAAPVESGAAARVRETLLRCGIRTRFPRAVLREADALPQTVLPEELAGRRDLRDTLTFTIDGADSRDFDDAVSIEPLENGNRLLGVHIADVARYVPENSLLDREARLRGTSVYFPFPQEPPEAPATAGANHADTLTLPGVVPMLPPQLSNGVCSLNEGVDRLTLSCLMEVDAAGEVVRSQIVESVIRSRRRLVYADVTAMLGQDGPAADALRAQNADVLPALRMLAELQTALVEKRAQRGSIDFDVPESEILLDEAGRAVGLKRAERGVANRIIEECMLLANQTVALRMLAEDAPILCRVHERPDRERMRTLDAFLRTMGLSVPHADRPRPRDIQQVLERVSGTPEEALVGKLCLRSMQKARYCEACLGHFGLAMRAYCHFTSPIRRYPDLYVHRVVKLWLHGRLDERARKRLSLLAPTLAEETSERERAAMEAERAVDRMKVCEYMATQVGAAFSGVVSGIASYGFYVELPNTAEGLVRLGWLTDDYYVAEPASYRLVGRDTGRVIRLGDGVNVSVRAADPSAGTIDFMLETGYDGTEIIYNLERKPAPVRSRQKKAAEQKRTGARSKHSTNGAKRGGTKHATRKGHQGAGTKPKGKA